MKDPDELGRSLAHTSSIMLTAGAVCIAAALFMGMVGIAGAFEDDPAAASMAMSAAIGAGLALLGGGLNRRHAARMAGWMPAPERSAAAARTAANADTKAVAADNGAASSYAAPDQNAGPHGHVPADSANRPQGSSSEGVAETDARQTVPQIVGDAARGAAAMPPSAIENFARDLRARREQSPTAAMMVARDRVETVDRMLLRSDDIFAQARDLAASGKSIDAFAGLSALLAQSNALDLEDPPQIRPIKLSRNGRYWLGMDVTEATDETYDAAIALEAALNLCHDMLLYEGEHPSAAVGMSVHDKACAALSATSRIVPDHASRTDFLSTAYPDAPGEGAVGEWAMRAYIANAAENAALSFRVVFDMRANAAERLVLVRLQVPRPACFSLVSADAAEQVALARDYAFRSALFMARAALDLADPTRAAQHAIVTCSLRGDDRVRLSLEATPQNLPSLQRLAASAMPVQNLAHPDLRASWAHEWLDPVDAHIEPDDPLFAPQRHAMAVELSDEPCGPRLAKAANAQVESDLGSIENAAKRRAWANLEGFLGTTTATAVEAARQLQTGSDDPWLRDACSRVMRALVDGTADTGQLDVLEAVFMDEGDLQDALSFGAMAYASQQEGDFERAVSKLSAALSPSMQIACMDDTETVFRHFRGTADRLGYNLHLSDGRAVRMVPVSYYAANEMAAHMLCLLGRAEDAQPYAEEIVRLAPTSASAAMTKARVLESMSRIFEAIDLINDAIAVAPTVHDAALAYYRMAYLQWRSGRHDVAAACYQVAIDMRTEIAHQARIELAELRESDDELESIDSDKAFAVLRNGGVSEWPREERMTEIARAAVLCADARLYPAAHQLGLALLEFRHDDALIDVCRSFGGEM